MKASMIIFLIFLSLLTISKAAPCGDEESAPWLETVEYDGDCVKGEKVKYQCKECKCSENPKTLLCPRWVKCCEKGSVWQTNSCNVCHCTDSYQRICEIAKCVFSS